MSEHELGRLNFRGRHFWYTGATSGLTVFTCKSSSGRKTRRSTTTRNCSSAKRMVELLAFTTCAIICKTDRRKLDKEEERDQTHRIYKLVGILWLVKL